MSGSVKQGLWLEEMALSQTGCSPQLPAATGGQGSLHVKTPSATTAVLTVTCLSDSTLLHDGLFLAREPCWNHSAERVRLCTVPVAAHCLRARQQQHWCLDTGRAGLPNKDPLITYTCGHTQPHQCPNRVLPNPGMYNSTLDQHWGVAQAPACPSWSLLLPLCPSLSQEGTWLCRLGHRTHQGQVPGVPTKTPWGNQRGSSLCYTLHNHPASFPHICVQKVP